MNKIAFAKPDIGLFELDSVAEVMESGWLTSGPKVKEFEKKVAELSGAMDAVAVDSCTSALELSLRALGIGPGDEVITTPLTYTATADVIFAVGAKIVFADTDGKTFEMDYNDVERKITGRTKAIIAVDYGGIVCDYDRIIKIAESHRDVFVPSNQIQESMGRIAVIADAAHSFMANRGPEKKSGSCADITCFSFHVLKNITTGGEGGAVCLKKGTPIDPEVFRMSRHHWQTGKNQANGWEYDILKMGYNRPMTDINAAIGLKQIERFGEIVAIRREITEKYDEAFSDLKRIRPMIHHFGKGFESAYHLYPVEVLDEDMESSESFRNKVILKMQDFGIPCNVHYKPLPMFTAYRDLGYDIADYPNAYRQYRGLVTLPYHTLLKQNDIRNIIGSLKRAVEE